MTAPLKRVNAPLPPLRGLKLLQYLPLRPQSVSRQLPAGGALTDKACRQRRRDDQGHNRAEARRITPNVAHEFPPPVVWLTVNVVRLNGAA
jgi:hypothetical protein